MNLFRLSSVSFLLSSCGASVTSTAKLFSDDPPASAISPADAAEIAILTGPPVWSRVDDHTLKFTGEFQTSDKPTALEQLNTILRPGDDTVVVNSGGGDVRTGLLMGQRLLPLKMTVIVDGVCASSCANYLFTAGAQKQIKRGWVGFHGDGTAFFGIGWPEVVKGLQDDRAQAHQPPYTDAELTAMRAQGAPFVQDEQAFLAAIGVQQALFDRAQLDDKGMGDGQQYGFLCPTPATFVKYGILHVSGVQDMTFIGSESHNVLN